MRTQGSLSNGHLLVRLYCQRHGEHIVLLVQRNHLRGQERQRCMHAACTHTSMFRQRVMRCVMGNVVLRVQRNHLRNSRDDAYTSKSRQGASACQTVLPASWGTCSAPCAEPTSASTQSRDECISHTYTQAGLGKESLLVRRCSYCCWQRLQCQVSGDFPCGSFSIQCGSFLSCCCCCCCCCHCCC
jgi:hypothetical protein